MSVSHPVEVTRHSPTGHPPVQARRVGVLIVNLGTPDGTDYWSMRRYLKEFLSDKRVIDEPRWKWWPILNLIILQTRPQKKGRDYETIWNRELDESPLRTITRSQSQKLSGLLGDVPEVVVDWGMRYGNPSIPSRLEALQTMGCDRILVVPLYPQYSAATTATVADKAFDALKEMRWQPAVRIAPPWHDDPVYIEAITSQMTKHIAGLGWDPEVVLASFHGVPQRYLELGDPYHCHCVKTARLMREKLGWSEDRLRLTFQSLFGPEEWLKPYTDKTVEALAKSGVKRLAIVNPGFTADCLETLEEIAGENAEIFKHHGGEQFAAIPCLNDTEAGMRVIETVTRRELSGWV
ncbi:ferrochelatase [Agaricicola taiwanensis]|nr:ferrochelatase [Agaricicola taiwanensis]